MKSISANLEPAKIRVNGVGENCRLSIPLKIFHGPAGAVNRPASLILTQEESLLLAVDLFGHLSMQLLESPQAAGPLERLKKYLVMAFIQ